MTIQQRKSRREFLYATGAAGLFAAGASTISLTALADQLHQTSLWPARVPNDAGRGTSLPQLGIRVYSKLGFGPRPDNPANPDNQSDLAFFNSFGINNTQRFTNWLDEQIVEGRNPQSSDPQVTSRLNGNSRYQTLSKSLTQLWDDHQRYDGANGFQVRNRPYWEMQLAAVTRAVHSKWQLREVLADFWHNHFNVDAGEDVVRSVLPDYDRNVIRAGMFGNFRQMLENVVKHAAMMYYLDNYRNTWPNPNENYARELLELHTLGAVDNYYGFVPADTVPMNNDGQPAGYVEADVLEMAKLLTGFGVKDGRDGDTADDGTFLFRANRHNNDPKTIMGQTVPPTGETELGVILDYLSSHRGTAEYICWKLAVRLIGDNFKASDSFIQSAANVFQNNWQASDQLELVYRHMLDTGTFKQAWADKARRPIEIITSGLRAANVDYDFELNSDEINANFYGYFSRIRDAGQSPFNCEPPTGYAEDRAIWKGSGPLIMSWRAITNMLRDVDSASGDNNFVNLAEQYNVTTGPGGRTPNAITDFWLNRILGFGHNTASAKRDQIVAFIATNGNAPANNQPLSIDTANTDRDSTYQQLMRGAFTLVALLPERMIR